MRQYNQFNLVQNSYFNQGCNADKKEPAQGNLLVRFLMLRMFDDPKTSYKYAYQDMRRESLQCNIGADNG